VGENMSAKGRFAKKGQSKASPKPEEEVPKLTTATRTSM
jgi:hypothetical protein